MQPLFPVASEIFRTWIGGLPVGGEALHTHKTVFIYSKSYRSPSAFKTTEISIVTQLEIYRDQFQLIYHLWPEEQVIRE